MGSRILLEVAVGSVDDALTAEHGGADRLELNLALELGGLTPSLGCLVEVRQAVSLPIMVMIRPRAGDFVFGSRHFQVMLRDIDLAVEHGADGIVFGVLNADARVDSLERLIDLGVKRVLTSGQKASAREGALLIADLIRRSQGRIEILPAAGINPETVMEVVERTGCDQVHVSLQTVGKGSASVDPRENFQGYGTSTDADAVVAMQNLLG
jgi:copper homeostasis protein